MIKELLINLVDSNINLLNEVPLLLRIDILITLLIRNNIFIIKGKYRGLIGSKIKSTPKNLYIKILGGNKVRIKKKNIKQYL